MNHTSPMGVLRVWITAAGGTLPVSGVAVQVRNEGGELLHVLRSGESGLTAAVALPAPAATQSLVPGAKAYTTYFVSVEVPGYTPVRELAVPLFDGITSLQPIALLPETKTGTADPLEPYLLFPHAAEPYANLQPEPDADAVDDIDLPDYGAAETGRDDQ